MGKLRGKFFVQKRTDISSEYEGICLRCFTLYTHSFSLQYKSANFYQIALFAKSQEGRSIRYSYRLSVEPNHKLRCPMFLRLILAIPCREVLVVSPVSGNLRSEAPKALLSFIKGTEFSSLACTLFMLQENICNCYQQRFLKGNY